MPNNARNQVSLAQRANIKNTPNKPKKRKSKNKTGLVVLLLVVLLATTTFLIVGGIWLSKRMKADEHNPDLVPLTAHTKTPDAYTKSMAYYLVGLFGEDKTSAVDTLAVVCWDKKKDSLSILQLPQDTYLGDSGRWAVNRLADVWANPKPIDWCTSCRRSVTAEEINEDKRHTVCNTTITQMTGSASQDLYAVVNSLLGLPIDGHLLIPQQALVKLVNLVGGIDIDLDAAMTVEGISYKKGVQLVDGNGALYYATNRKTGITNDIQHAVKQRKVLLSLFQRLTHVDSNKLSGSILGPLMNGSTPIYSNLKRADIIQLIEDMRGVKPEAMTAYMLPGEQAKAGGKTYFTANRASLLTLLNESFVPYGPKVTEAQLGITQIAAKTKPDLYKQVLSEIAVAQSSIVPTTTKAAS